MLLSMRKECKESQRSCRGCSMVILETSFLVDILRNSSTALQLLDELELNESVLWVATPTVMELWQGTLQSNLTEKEQEKVEQLLSRVTTLDFDTRAAKRTAEVLVYLKQNHQCVETQDAMISGIALTKGKTVVTRDADFAKIPGLRVLKY
jgi:tRNA(fMet)-specific endonuclease VapC